MLAPWLPLIRFFLRYPTKIVVVLLHFVINLCARVDQRISWCAKDCLLLTPAGPRFLPVFPLQSFSKNIGHHGEGRCTSLHSILCRRRRVGARLQIFVSQLQSSLVLITLNKLQCQSYSSEDAKVVKCYLPKLVNFQGR